VGGRQAVGLLGFGDHRLAGRRGHLEDVEDGEPKILGHARAGQVGPVQPRPRLCAEQGAVDGQGLAANLARDDVSPLFLHLHVLKEEVLRLECAKQSDELPEQLALLVLEAIACAVVREALTRASREEEVDWALSESFGLDTAHVAQVDGVWPVRAGDSDGVLVDLAGAAACDGNARAGKGDTATADAVEEGENVDAWLTGHCAGCLTLLCRPLVTWEEDQFYGGSISWAGRGQVLLGGSAVRWITFVG